MYFEFLFRRAHSRRRVERKYWSGVSLYSLTTCSNSVTVGTIGPMGSGLPQFGLPRLLAMSIPRIRFMPIKLDSGDLRKDSESFTRFTVKNGRKAPGLQTDNCYRSAGATILRQLSPKSMTNQALWF